MHGFVLVAFLFTICHQTQTNNSIGKPGKAILHLQQRTFICVLWEGTPKCGWKKKDHLTNTTQTVFQKVSIVQYRVHHDPSLVFKVTGKQQTKDWFMVIHGACVHLR